LLIIKKPKKMKKSLIILAVAALAFTGCDKDPDTVSRTVDVSYPIITLNGDEVVSQPIGTGSYVDPGATGTDDITGATTTLSPVLNNVDLTTAGFYSVKYTMSNANGYISNKVRLVLVTPVDPAVDLSGTYARTSNGQTVTVTKRGTGLYTTDNVGGVANNPAFIFDVYFGQISDTEIQVPVQPSGLGGDIYCDNGTLDLNIPITYSYVVHGTGFGTAVRTFVKQ
jgi:hypothetical protein